MNTIDLSFTEEVYSVSRLNREVRFLLESNFPSIWVEGEISNFVCPNSGHWYFSIKDATAQTRCAMFKQYQRRLTHFVPKDGDHVLVKARISLYEGRGDFQLLVEHIEDAGEGKLRQEFEALKKRLSAAGLFAESHKKKLPSLPKTIGVVTSPTGAAIRDILSVLRRRFSCANVIIYPTLVQGTLAANNIVQAIQVANQRAEAEVIILARGGGSLEDLWPFNEEKVAYAIFQSHIPIITGVGHEIDFTIADFVADVRAPTPSAAAELIVPETKDLQRGLTEKAKIISRLMRQTLENLSQQLVWAKKQLELQHPQRRLNEQHQRLDFFAATLTNLMKSYLNKQQTTFLQLNAKLQTITPAHRIKEIKQQLLHQHDNLKTTITNLLERKQLALANVAAQLDTLSPLATLHRGYSIVMDKDQQLVRSVKDVKLNDQLNLQLKDGNLDCKVEKLTHTT